MYIYFLLSKCEFLSDKKKSKTPKNKNVVSVLQELFFTFLSFIWGEGDTAVYETGFFFLFN